MHTKPPGRIDRTVLVGSTLGPLSDAVVKTALAIARQSCARVLMLHVLEPQGEVAAGLLSFPMVREGVSAAACERLSAQLHRLGARTSEVADIAVAVPPIHAALLRAVVRSRAQFLVLGSNDDDVQSPRVGSLSLQMLRCSPQPLWLVKGHGPLIPTKVLLHSGLAPLACGALSRCLEVLASCLPAAATEVVVLCVLENDDPRNVIDEAQALDRALGDHAARFDGRLRAMVRRGSPAQVVVAAIEEQNVDLVLLARHRPVGRARCVRDPVVEAVAIEARCAVLLVPLGGAELGVTPESRKLTGDTR